LRLIILHRIFKVSMRKSMASVHRFSTFRRNVFCVGKGQVQIRKINISDITTNEDEI